MLVTDQSFRDAFNFREPSVDLAGYLQTAGAELKAWVGQEAYEDAEKLTDADGDTTPTDVQRAHRLKLAETYLAMYYAYPVLSVQVESGVVVLADRSEGELVRQMQRPKEIREGAQLFYDQAQELAQPYMVVPETTEPSFTPPPFIVVG